MRDVTMSEDHARDLEDPSDRGEAEPGPAGPEHGPDDAGDWQPTMSVTTWEPTMSVESEGPRWKLLTGVGVALLLLIGVGFIAGTRLPGGTTLAGLPLADASGIDGVLDDAQDALDGLPVTFATAADSQSSLTGADLGLEVDRQRSGERLGSGLPSISTWVRRITQGPQAEPLQIRPVDSGQLDSAAADLTVPATNAGVLVQASGVDVTDPADGLMVAPADVDAALQDAIAQISTLAPASWPSEVRVEVGGEATPPSVQRRDIDEVLTQIETLESAEVTLTASTPVPPQDEGEDGGSALSMERTDTEIVLSPRELRALVSVEDTPAGELLLQPDLAAAPPRVVALLDLAQVDPIVQARIDNRSATPELGGDLTDVSAITGDVVLEGSQGGFVPDRQLTLAAIIEAGMAGGGSVEVIGESGEEATPETIGIIEPVSTFTTFYTPGQSRNINIQRMAEIVDGTIIPAGASYELNHAVGRRTRENGFVAGGAIIDGELTTDIGGGVSQFATTFFNASWFAGIELVDWKAHSIYFSRYPAGREATVNYPNVNLEVRNDTPHAILVDTDTDDSSVTVTFWSLPHWEVQTITGPCACGGEFSINVDRIRTPPDGPPITETWSTFYTVERRREQ